VSWAQGAHQAVVEEGKVEIERGSIFVMAEGLGVAEDVGEQAGFEAERQREDGSAFQLGRSDTLMKKIGSAAFGAAPRRIVGRPPDLRRRA
jgi:hypothetical protein